MSPGGKRSSTDPPRSKKDPRPLARGLLIALALLLPFEAPVLAVGPLTLTTVELVLYALLGVWAVGLAVDRVARRGAGDGRDSGRGRGRGGWSFVAGEARVEIAGVCRDGVARAVAIWLLVIVASALAAPAERTAALKFALRALAGGALFFAARNLVRTAADRRTVGGAILIGAVVSGAGAILEIALPTTAVIWHPFRATTFSVTGLPRPSGPFGYPTIAAMYWEAALPLAIPVPLMGRGAARPGGGPRSAGGGVPWTAAAAAIAAAAVLIGATLFSATRTALAVAALASVAMVVLTWKGGRAIRIASAGTLALILLLATSVLAGASAGSPLAIRLRWWQDGNWFRARYTTGQELLTMTTGSFARVAVAVENTGALMWPHAGEESVQLSYHWEKQQASGPRLAFEGRRSALPIDVAPGAAARVVATVQAPDEPGRYRLRWDLVRERVIWFSERGSPTGDQDVEIVRGAARAGQRAGSTLVDSSLEAWVAAAIPTRPELWRAALRLWRSHPLLGVGPDNFRRLYPEALGPFQRNAIASYDRRTHANSLYFETLADEGIAGVLALALLIGAVGRAAWRRLGTGGSLLTAAFAVALGTYFVHGLLDYFLAFTPTYGLYWLLMALLVGADERSWATTPAPADSRS